MSETGIQGPLLWIIGLAVTAFFAVATWALSEWRKKTGAQATATLQSVVLARVLSIVEAVVFRLNATLKVEYTALTADGTLSKEDGKKLATTALQDVKAVLTEQGLAALRGAFGWGPTETDQHLLGVIEKQVVEAKALTAVATGTQPRP